ncbi:MAG: sphaericase (sfericase) [Parcubacteria group bacterium Licking1014_17]|nr:MAG: sphaericase (sfericase) [Parcubacteria group bacterium Licking1014_17]
MSKKYNLIILLVLGAFLVLAPLNSARADGGRYFVKSTKKFWKNTFGARHYFADGFTADLNALQIRLAKFFGVKIEEVPAFNILAEAVLPESSLNQEKIPDSWGIKLVTGNSVDKEAGAGVNVAVLDTGIDKNNPVLAGRVAECKNFADPRFPIAEDECTDDNSHGTHISAVIAADGGENGSGFIGVAPASKLHVFKVCNGDGSCYADDIATAIKTAADEKTTDIIYMGFGSSVDNQFVREAVDYATSKNILLIAPAGNDGPFSNSVDYPASYAEVIAVGAVNQLYAVTGWSSRGKNMTFVAPGDEIVSVVLDNKYASYSGTSMAASFIAGLAARVWQSDSLNPAESTVGFLKSLAENNPNNKSFAYKTALGFGVPVITSGNP